MSAPSPVIARNADTITDQIITTFWFDLCTCVSMSDIEKVNDNHSKRYNDGYEYHSMASSWNYCMIIHYITYKSRRMFATV